MRFWGGGLPTAYRHIIQHGQSILLKLLITPICIVSKPIQGLKPELFCALCSILPLFVSFKQVISIFWLDL